MNDDKTNDSPRSVAEQVQFDQSSTTHTDTSILRGQIPAKDVTFEKSIRIFTSSTFTDTSYERNELMMKVYPALSDFCRTECGFDLRIVDMRWGIRDEMTNDWRTTELCLNEIQRCKTESVGIFFVTMVDQKFGYCPPPRSILKSEFLSILDNVDKDEVSLMNWFYTHDTNAVPDVYVLRSLHELYPSFALHEVVAKVFAMSEFWDKYEKLCNALRLGVSKSTSVSDEQKMEYFMSVTEGEIRSAIDKADISNPIIWFRRNVTGLDDSIPMDKNPDVRLLSAFAEYRVAEDKQSVERVPIAKEGIKKLHQLLCDTPAIVVQDIEQAVSFADLSSKSRSPALEAYLTQFCDTFKKTLLNRITQYVLAAQQQSTNGYHPRLIRDVSLHLSVLKTMKVELNLLRGIQVHELTNSGPYVLLHGEIGVGKSTTCASIASTRAPVNENDGRVLFVRFCDRTCDSNDISALLVSLTSQMKALCGVDVDYDMARHTATDEDGFVVIVSEWLSTLELLGTCFTAGQVTIIIDGLDKLIPDENLLTCAWLPRVLPSAIGMFMLSCCAQTDVFYQLKRLSSVPLAFVEIQTIQSSSGDLEKALTLQLEQRFYRQLTPIQMNQLTTAINKNQSSHPVAYAAMLAPFAAKWRSDHDIDALSIGKDVSSVATEFLQVVETEHHLLAKTALALLTVSRYGLSDAEMDDLLSANEKVLDDVCQYHQPPFRRIPPLLWTRLRQGKLQTLRYMFL